MVVLGDMPFTAAHSPCTPCPHTPRLPTAAPELAALAVAKLEAAVLEVEAGGAAAYLALHAAPQQFSAAQPVGAGEAEGPGRTPEPEGAAAAAAEGQAGQQEGQGQAGGMSPMDAEGGEQQQRGAAGAAGAAGDEHGRQQLQERQVTDAVRDLDRCGWSAVVVVGGWRSGAGPGTG